METGTPYWRLALLSLLLSADVYSLARWAVDRGQQQVLHLVPGWTGLDTQDMKFSDLYGRTIELTPCDLPLILTINSKQVFRRVIRIQGYELHHPLLDAIKPLRFALRRNTKFVYKNSPRYPAVSPAVARRSDPNAHLCYDNGAWLIAELRTGVRMIAAARDRKTALGVFMNQLDGRDPATLIQSLVRQIQEWERYHTEGESYREAMCAAGFPLEPGLDYLSEAQQIELARQLLKT